jgi:hypothetical protein
MRKTDAPDAPKARTLTGPGPLVQSLDVAADPLAGKGGGAHCGYGPWSARWTVGTYGFPPRPSTNLPVRVSSRRSQNGATPRTNPGNADAGTDGTGQNPGIRLHQRTEPKARTCARMPTQGCHRENLSPSAPPESYTQPRAYPHPKMPDASPLARHSGSPEGLSGRSEVHFRLNHKRRETPDCGQDRLAHDTSGPGKRWLDTVWSAGDRSIRRVASSLSPSGSRQDMRKGDLYEYRTRENENPRSTT